MEGYLYSLKIKEIEEDSLYSKEEYKKVLGKNIVEKEFISIKDLKIVLSDEETTLSDCLFNTSEEMQIENKDNLFSEEILESFDTKEIDFIMMEIIKYKIETPLIKISDNELKNNKLKIETTDLEALTDSIIDEEVIQDIKYNDKKLNIYSQGLIFKSKIKKEIITKEILTYNLEDYNPCLENKIKL